MTNVFVQLVILLYLIDNNENTSWMILMGSGIGVLIEAWKVFIVAHIAFRLKLSMLISRSPKLWISALDLLRLALFCLTRFSLKVRYNSSRDWSTKHAVPDKHVLSEDELKTQEYDKLAFTYVSYAAIPLLAGYTVYSLLYEAHKGWYSFIISTLTSFVYMFGFVRNATHFLLTQLCSPTLSGATRTPAHHQL